MPVKSRSLKYLAVLMALSWSSASAMELTSLEVAPGATLSIAQVHSECGGQNIAPALTWSGAPQGTRSFAVTMYDPDAHGGWWHWIVYAIPANVSGLAGGAALPAGARLGENDFGKKAYGGACPPRGSGTHHYQITVWALGTITVPVEGAEEGKIIGPYLETHALAHATITAIYER